MLTVADMGEGGVKNLKKIWTNHSSDTVLQFVQIFLKQTLLYGRSLDKMICQLEEMKGPTNLILNHQATQILFHRSSSPCTRLILNDFGFMYLDVMSPFLQSNARQVANNNMPGLKRNVSLFFSFLLCESNFICSTNFFVLNVNKTDNCLTTANDCLTTA